MHRWINRWVISVETVCQKHTHTVSRFTVRSQAGNEKGFELKKIYGVETNKPSSNRISKQNNVISNIKSKKWNLFTYSGQWVKFTAEKLVTNIHGINEHFCSAVYAA